MPSAAQPGQPFTINGFGFVAGETVTVLFGGDVNAAVADGEGFFSLLSAVPEDMPAGFHPMEAFGNLGSFVEIEYEVLTLG